MARSTASWKPEERHRRIAEAAYFKAERRGFQGGSPVRDWLEAEAEIDATMSKLKPQTTRARTPARRRRRGEAGAEAG
jgi:hypothetical protein